MPQILFFSPPADVINGGIKYIYRMAETLREFGYDAAVIEEQERRPNWFHSTIPIVGQSALREDAGQTYVLPEDQTHMLTPLRGWPQRKVVYCQNHFYSTYRLHDLQNYADYGVQHILCSSRTIYDYMRVRHAGAKAHIVPYSIDTARFHPAPKQKRIAYMPRKRPVDSIFIRDWFRFTYPDARDWQWMELNNLSEDDVAANMNEAQVFLSLSRMEGFGLTPLEAMAAGCVVAGFTGIAGREYATKENGFWAEEDDFTGCAAQLKAAVDMAQSAQRDSYFAKARQTIAQYTPAHFRDAVKNVWKEILG